MKTYSKNKEIKLIGFKLTSGANEKIINEKVLKIFESGADYIVHNDLGKITNDEHPSQIYYKGKKIMNGLTKQDLANNLKDIISGTE